jgi:hypothetical protein
MENSSKEVKINSKNATEKYATVMTAAWKINFSRSNGKNISKIREESD